MTLLSEMGVHDVRLTGGEPLVRRNFPELVGMLSAIEQVDDLSITTNGFLLERDAEALVKAGANRFNVSIDSLQADRFYEITRRNALDRVLRGLDRLAEFPEAHPIKVNAVAIRGFTEDEVPAFVKLARESPYVVRFIEFMPLDADHAWSRDRVINGAELVELVSAVHPIEPSSVSRARLRGSTDSLTDRAGSVSSTPSQSRSAETAIASASRPRGSSGRVCSH